MIDRDHALPLARQAQQLEISHGSIYYLPRSVSSADLEQFSIRMRHTRNGRSSFGILRV